MDLAVRHPGAFCHKYVYLLFVLPIRGLISVAACAISSVPDFTAPFVHLGMCNRLHRKDMN